MQTADALRTDLEPFLEPASAVVVGASERNGVARAFVRNLVAGGVRVAGTHPRERTLDGVPVVPSVGDLDHVPDIACVALGVGNAVAGVEDALAAGVRHLVVPGLGPEAGPAGHEARERLAAACAAAGALVVGPNGMGVLVPGGASAWIGTVAPSMRRGGVAAIVQSGSIGEALTGMGPRVGLRTIVSTGNEAAGDAADWVAFLADDPETRAIGVMLETVRRPGAFAAALTRAAAAGKPVAALKTGTSVVGAERALAHSGAIAGSDAAFDAFCRAHGVIRSLDYGDWVEVLDILGCGRRPRGPRLVVVTNSGGEGEHAADLAERAGLPLAPLPVDLAQDLDGRWALDGAANPLDYYAFAAQEEILPAVVTACAAHPEVDGVLVNVDQSHRFVGSEQRTGLLVGETAAAAAEATGAFVAVLSTSTSDAPDAVIARCAEAGVPVLKGHGPGFRALAALLAAVPPAPGAAAGGEAASPAALPDTGGPLPEADSKAVLAAYGLRAPRERRAVGADDAVAAAEAIGYPVVVKADGPAHKERAGGVHLGIATPAAVRAATEACGGRVLVAEELRGGVEVLCGMVRDPLYGPLVVCGVGGSWAEPLRALARTALAPLDADAARALVRSVAPLAERLGAAGVEVVAATLVALGRVAAELPRVREIDVNPLRVDGADAVALDGLVVLDPA
jgi:acetate---CoA ligase (ADP-forming)